MSESIPRLIAEGNPRVPRDMAVFHYLTTPPADSEAAYKHYVAETARLIWSLRPDAPPAAIASVWAVADRALDYTCKRGPRCAGREARTLH